MITNQYKELFESVIKSNIKTERIRDFALVLSSKAPDYFFVVPGSSSGKYHPASDLGEGGLIRHSINVMKILDYIMCLEQCVFTAEQKDLLRVAALFHDSLKSGSQEQYDAKPFTKHLHPLYAADFVRLTAKEVEFNESDAEFIASAISTHMGEWTTSKYERGILPKPSSSYQKSLHLADYLASRKEITIG